MKNTMTGFLGVSLQKRLLRALSVVTLPFLIVQTTGVGFLVRVTPVQAAEATQEASSASTVATPLLDPATEAPVDGTLSALSAPVTPTLLADTGFLTPTATHTPNQWTSPDNGRVSDDVYTTETTESDEQGYSSFGFSVPAGSTIDGISAQVEAKSTDTSGCVLRTSLSWNNGSNYLGTWKEAALTGTDTILGFGDASDTWGRTWSPSEFSNANFVLKIEFDDQSGNACSGATVSVDSVQAKVHYTSRPTPLANPQLGQSCGLDMGLVIDSSGSIDTTELGQMKTAFKSFVDAFLPGTPTQMSVVEFDTNVVPPTLGFTNNITNIKNDIDASVSGGYTNWEDAIAESHSLFPSRLAKPDLMVFASDGNPNTVGTTPPSSGGTASEATAVDAAVVAANAAKTDGIRVLALGIGNDLNVDNLKAISGTNVNTGVTSDVITSNFDTLAADLAALAHNLCGGKVLVQKQFDTNGDGTPEYDGSTPNALLADWNFDVNGSPSNPAPQTTTNTGALEFSVLNGTYSVVETALKPNTSLESAHCVKGTAPIGTFDPGTRTISGLTMGTDDTISCTFVNGATNGTLHVIKHVVGGPATADQWSIHVKYGVVEVPGSPQPGSETGTDYSLPANTYDISETGGPTGYTASFSASCPNGVAAVAPGLTTTCTITNTRDTGSVLVNKMVDTDGNGSFEGGNTEANALGFRWQLDGGSDRTMGTTATNVPTDSHLVNENSVANYHFVGWYQGTQYTCANTPNTTLPVSVDVTKDATTSITLCNARDTGTLTVIKHVVNDNGGTRSAADFTMNVTGTNVSDPSFPGSEAGTTVTLATGSYSVDEGAMTGYTKSLGANCSGSIANGEHKTCTVTNNDQAASLTVIKHVINDNSGTKSAADFTMNVTGTNVSSASFPGEEAGTTVSLDAGAYSVDEGAMTGYAKSLGANCSGSIANGEHKTCTVTNNDIQPLLTVTKVVVNDNGGTRVVNDFPLFVGATQVTSGQQNGFNAGSYVVSETNQQGYTPAISGDCDVNGNITLNPGDTKTCIITNDDQTAHLTLVKEVMNDNGGTAVPTAWTLTADGPTPLAGAGGVDNDVDAGVYTLSETGGPAGYVAGAWNCGGVDVQQGDQIALSPGQSATCTITNDDQTARLIVYKLVYNDNGGDAIPSDFTMHVDGVNSSPASFPGSNLGTLVTLDQGSYAVTEDPVAGYSPIFSEDCIGSIAVGQTKYCTVTNSSQAAHLIVTKHVINDNGGSRSADEFSLTIGGVTVPDGATFPGAESPGTDKMVLPGTYDVTEAPVAGYTPSYSEDCSGTIALGETKFCTITNDDEAPTITLIKHVQNDNGGNAGANDFGLTIGGIPVTSGQTLAVEANTPHALNEAGLTGYNFVSITGDKICPSVLGGDVTLNEGEDITCTITNDDQPGSISGYKYDNHEHPLDGWQICLTFSNDDLLTSSDAVHGENCVRTGAGEWPDGYYEFTGVDAGNYIITETVQPGWMPVDPPTGEQGVEVALGQPTHADFINREIFPDLSVTKTDGLTTATPGQLVSYTIVVSNGGEYLADNVLAVDTLPPQATYVSSTIDAVDAPASVAPNAGGDVLTWNLGTMNAGTSKTIVVTVQLDALFPFGTTTMTNLVVVSTESEESNTSNNSATDTTDVAAAPTINFGKTGPATVIAGDNITYTLAWSVAGNAQATNALITDPLPANTTFVSANCGTTAGTCTIDSTTSTIKWSLGTRNPGESGNVTLTVKSNSPLANGTVITNTGTFDTAENDPVPKTVTTAVQSAPIIAVVKSDTPDPVTAGSQLTYSIVWSVAGNSPVTNLVITDPIPSNTTFVSATNSGVYNVATKVVTWTLGSHLPGDSGTVNMTVAVASPLANGTVLTNTATIDSDENTPVTDTETTVVASAPVLTISKTVNLPFANPGDAATYTVTVTNTGNDKAVNAVLTDTLPAGFTFVDGGGTTKSFALGTIEAGKSVTVVYNVLVDFSVAAGTYKNLANAKADNAPEVSAQAALDVRLPVVEAGVTTPAIVLEKTVNRATANPGDEITYILTVKNTGSAPAEDVRLDDTLPADFTFADTGSAKRIWTIGTLLDGETRTITYRVKVGDKAKAGDHTNVVLASAKDLDPVTATATVKVVVPKVKGLTTTGASAADYALFFLGLSLVCAAGIGLRKTKNLGV